MAHGDTQAGAAAEIQTAIALWVDTGAEFGDPIPPPSAYEPLADRPLPLFLAQLAYTGVSRR